MIVRLNHERPVSQTTVLDPSGVIVAKSLLTPFLVVMTLVLCFLAAHAPLGVTSFLLAALTFLAAAALVKLEDTASDPLSLRAFLDLWLHWLLLLAILSVATTLSGLGT